MTRRHKKIAGYCLVAVALVGYYACLPGKLFPDPYSTVLEDAQGELLSASIAGDGQWRFPQSDSVPSRFEAAIITFEDKRFYYHPGVDPLSMMRALRQNISAGRVVSGGSTLSMQVIRLARKGQDRTVLEKLWEIVLATRLEFRYSKTEILNLYASHAPFGGNVVGLEAACWRYYGRSLSTISWSEAALLAVLPNAPSLIHPGKNRELLRTKRDGLLDKLLAVGKIDSFTCALAKEEPIPAEPRPLPRYARHLLTRMQTDGHGQQKVRSTVQLPLQRRVEQIVADHHQRLRANQVFNAAALVLDVHTGNTLAYVGNTNVDEPYHGDEVDVITAARSTGSILKPFLYAAMLDEGRILPHTILPDVPTVINGFAPKNFSRQFDGAVPADQALIRSLNIPAVYLLRDYRYERFHSLLSSMGMTTLTQPPDHYGLSLILGGAEGSLWDIAGIYASMARTLNKFSEHTGENRYSRADFHSPRYTDDGSQSDEMPEATSWLSAGAVYQTFEALKELSRPGEESGWRYFSSSKPIAWKTGTSFGLRDAWAVGVTPDYVVAAWAGNADGEGRPGLTGTDAAAPMLFDIFAFLPGGRWFEKPGAEMHEVNLCARSGHRSTDECDAVVKGFVLERGLESSPCPYHQQIHLSKDKKYRVNSTCAQVSDMVVERWFVLPPLQEYYYRSQNLSYRSLPPLHTRCASTPTYQSMGLVYPKPNTRIFIPRDLGGELGSTIFELVHRSPTAKVYWHLDGSYLGTTQKSHRLGLSPGAGKHTLTLVDEQGEILEETFEVISKM